MAGKAGWHHTIEARERISASKRGKPRPDLAERNRTSESRARPRVVSEAGRARIVEAKTVHGHSRKRGTRSGTSTYNIWAAMIQRCTNPNNTDWKYYGARGISVCLLWMDFENFLRDMGERPEGLSIDRIDNDGDYGPGNCRWATAEQQAANKRPYGSAVA